MATAPASTTSAPRRDPARRMALLAAAAEAFAHAGYAATSMDEIAATAGITKLIVYRHFESKEVLYRAVLEQVFQKSPAEAYRIMMRVHLNGRGVAGVYPWEVAETKIDTVLSRAREDGYPLQATIEDA